LFRCRERNAVVSSFKAKIWLNQNTTTNERKSMRNDSRSYWWKALVTGLVTVTLAVYAGCPTCENRDLAAVHDTNGCNYNCAQVPGCYLPNNNFFECEMKSTNWVVTITCTKLPSSPATCPNTQTFTFVLCWNTLAVCNPEG
jgi:hypothetical protein